MKLLGTARNGSLVLLQAWIGAPGSTVTRSQLLGHGLSTCAFVAYTLLRVYGGAPATPMVAKTQRRFTPRALAAKKRL